MADMVEIQLARVTTADRLDSKLFLDVAHEVLPGWTKDNAVLLRFWTDQAWTDASIELVFNVLPGWWVTCGHCSLSGHASIGPDYNGPHRERLLRDFPEERFHGGFDADLQPGDGLHRTALAILTVLLMALEATRPAAGRVSDNLSEVERQ